MSGPVLPAGQVISSAFDDFDCFAEAAKGWDLAFHQLDQGSFAAELTHVLTPSVIVSECRLGRKVHQQGCPPPGFRTFGFAADDHFDIVWRGKQVDENCLLVFPPGAPLDSVSPPGFGVFVVSIAESWLEEAAGARGLDSLEALFSGPDVLQVAPAARRRLARLARRFVAGGLDQPQLVFDWGYRERLLNEMGEGVLAAIGDLRRSRGIRELAATRRRAVDTAIGLIQARAAEPVTIAEVERAAGVSPRTLRYAFREFCGMSPKQYLQCYRLDRVRRELRLGAPVSEAAKRWGFWHLGQFASDYRRQFGELPSATLAGTAG